MLSDVDSRHSLTEEALMMNDEDEGELTPVGDHSVADFGSVLMDTVDDEAEETEEVGGDDQLVKRRRVDRPAGDLVDVRMIDFTHTTFSGYLGDVLVHWGPDNGYLLGLDSLNKILNEIRQLVA